MRSDLTKLTELTNYAFELTKRKLNVQKNDCEVAESYMDAKFGGEDADMVEIVGGW